MGHIAAPGETKMSWGYGPDQPGFEDCDKCQLGHSMRSLRISRAIGSEAVSLLSISG
jgi:hypothetical protein